MNVISSSLRTRLLWVLVAAFATGAIAQPTLTIPDTSGRKGDTLLVPVLLSGIGANSLYSIQATVDLGSSHAQVVGISTAGSLTVGSSASYFTTTRRLAVALTTPVTADGTLLYLQVALTGTPGQTVSLGLSSVLLNEGTPTPTLDAGSVRLRVVHIAPNYLANVAVGDSVQFTASGDVVLPVTWSTSSNPVGTIDVSGKFRAVAPGFVTVYATDGEGKSDSTVQFNVVPNVIKSLTLWIPDTSRTQTLEVAVPVRVTTVTGLGITSAQFRLTFNTSHLEYLGVNVGGGMVEPWGAPVINDLTPGVLDFALAGSDTLSGAGTLLWVRFRVKQSAVGSSTIGLANAVFNETINPALDPGTFTVIPAPLIKVNTSRIVAFKGETVTVPSVTGGTSPFVFSSSNPAVASVDPSTGLLTVLTRGPVLVQAVDAQGFPGKSDTVWTYDFTAVVADTSVFTGDSVDVSVSVGSTTGLGIVSYQFRLSYDTSKVFFRGVSLVGTLSDGFTPVVKDTAGVLHVAVAGATLLAGEGILAKLRFAPNPPSMTGEQTILALSNFLFNEPGSSTPAAYPVNGRIRVIVPNAVPVFVNVLPDTSINEGQSLTFMYTASDANGDPLRYTLLAGPTGAAIDSVTGLLSYSPGFAASGIHPVTVRVTDGAAADTATALVTVVNVDRAPSFAQVLPDTTIIAGSTLTVTYLANDPDGDIVRYFMTTGPAFASIDSITGTLTATTAPTNVGNHPIQVTATAGGLSVVTSATLTVQSSGTSVHDMDTGIPKEFGLSANYPNPFNPSTRIRFALPAESRVVLTVHDRLGRRVAILVDGRLGAGVHETRWDASSMASGLYFSRIETISSSGERFVGTRKMILMK